LQNFLTLLRGADALRIVIQRNRKVLVGRIKIFIVKFIVEADIRADMSE